VSAARSYHDADMEMFETRTYRFMLGLSRLILLNLAWAVASLPVVTFIPATAAMFGVIREWRRGDEPSVFPRFVHHFRANFRQAFGIGLLWLLTALVLVLDYRLADQLPGAAVLPFLVLTTMFAIAFALTSVYLFPVIVEYEADWKNLIRNSLLISLSQLHTSIAALAVVAGGGFLALRIPLTLLIVPSGVAYLIHAICSHGLRRVEQLKSTTT
jgi:uncharacterized membrane protein YesL